MDYTRDWGIDWDNGYIWLCFSLISQSFSLFLSLTLNLRGGLWDGPRSSMQLVGLCIRKSHLVLMPSVLLRSDYTEILRVVVCFSSSIRSGSFGQSYKEWCPNNKPPISDGGLESPVESNSRDPTTEIPQRPMISPTKPLRGSRLLRYLVYYCFSSLNFFCHLKTPLLPLTGRWTGSWPQK